MSFNVLEFSIYAIRISIILQVTVKIIHFKSKKTLPIINMNYMKLLKSISLLKYIINVEQ